MTESEIDDMLAKVRAQLHSTRHYGCKFELKKSFSNDDRKASIFFSQTAWIKMTSLVVEFSTEVQWHGLVRRLTDSDFEVYDVIVPPHTVTSTTVTSDIAKYTEWINELDDATFSALRFHGHSHVNMGVTPSGTDSTYRKDVVTQLPKPKHNQDVFYMFMIINKKHEWSAEIYDLTNNALYSTADIDIYTLLDDNNTIDTFIDEAKNLAKPEVVQHSQSAGTASTGAIVKSGQFGGYAYPHSIGFSSDGYGYDEEDYYNHQYYKQNK